MQDDEIFTRITTATSPYNKWKKVPLDNRINLVKQFIKSLVQDKQKLKPIIAAEIGKSYQNINEQFYRI